MPTACFLASFGAGSRLSAPNIVRVSRIIKARARRCLSAIVLIGKGPKLAQGEPKSAIPAAHIFLFEYDCVQTCGL